MQEVEVLRSAVGEFARRLEVIAEGQWDLLTPCQAWTVRDLVEHVIDGNRLAVALLDGATSEQAMARLRSSEPTGDPGVEVRRTAETMLGTFTQSGALERVCDHPAVRITGRAFALYRAGDIVVHAWDLARAIRADEALDRCVVEAALDTYVPWVTSLHTQGMFGPGPSCDIPADAPRQQRLLDALGRRP